MFTRKTFFSDQGECRPHILNYPLGPSKSLYTLHTKKKRRELNPYVC